MKKLKITYILEKFPSPTEYFVLNEILQLERNGVEILIIVLRKQKKYLNIPELKTLKSQIVYLPKVYFYLPILSFLLSPSSIIRFPSVSSKTLRSGFWSPTFLLKFLRNYCLSACVIKKMKRFSCTHIHAHFAFISADIASISSNLLNLTFSFTAHAQDIYTNENEIREKLNSASFAITCTNYNKEYFNKMTDFIHENKIYKVYHGIKCKKWVINTQKIKNNSAFQIISVARLVEKKGLIYLLKAVNILIKQGKKVQCTIVGEGPLKEQLRNYIETERLDSFIQISQFVPQNEIKELLIKSDVFVLPCTIANNGDRDGLPNVILEAMLGMLPVISTHVSGIPEVIKHMETGLLVKEKDELAIANALKLLMEDNGIYQDMVLNARNNVNQKFDIQTCTNELVSIFESNIQK